METDPLGSEDRIPNTEKLPPDRHEAGKAKSNVIADLMLQNGISTQLETADLDTTLFSYDGEEFQEVESKRPKRYANGENVCPSQFKSTNIDISSFGSTTISINRFELLGQLNIEVNRSSSTSRKAAKNAEINGNVERNSDELVSKKFCPPIILHKVNVKKLVDQLNDRFPKVVNKIVNSSRNKSKFVFKDLSAHIEMMELLRSQNTYSVGIEEGFGYFKRFVPFD